MLCNDYCSTYITYIYTHHQKPLEHVGPFLNGCALFHGGPSFVTSKLAGCGLALGALVDLDSFHSYWAATHRTFEGSRSVSRIGLYPQNRLLSGMILQLYSGDIIGTYSTFHES